MAHLERVERHVVLAACLLEQHALRRKRDRDHLQVDGRAVARLRQHVDIGGAEGVGRLADAPLDAGHLLLGRALRHARAGGS